MPAPDPVAEQPCRTDVLYHYLLSGDSAPEFVETVLRDGLRSLSDLRNERWEELQREVPGWFEQLYADWAEPVIGRPYPRSGVFLTPIDFRAMPGSMLADRARFTVDVDRIDPDWSVLTYELDGARQRRRPTEQAFGAIAATWSADLIDRWFAVDRTKLFFYVPQVAVYQPDPVPVDRFEPVSAS